MLSITNLLSQFYTKNFQRAGVDLNLAEELISNLSNPHKITRIFKIAKKASIYPITELEPFSLFDLSKVKTFLDIGANKLTLLNQLPAFYPNINRLIGIDIIPQSKKFAVPQISEYYQINPEFTDFPLDKVSPNTVDFINLKFVIHHFPEDDSIKRCLSICRQLLKSNGTLLVWEETFDETLSNNNSKIKHLVQNNNRLNIQTDFELTRDFYQLNNQEKIKFIKTNDRLISTHHPHMPWTDQYKSWQDWLAIITSQKFKLNKSYNLGLRLNGRLKQGIHIIGQFAPTNFLHL